MLFRPEVQDWQTAVKNPREAKIVRIHSPMAQSEFARSILLFERLESLEIGWQNWRVIPDELATRPELKKLRVLNTPLEEISVISHLPSLVDLTVRGTDIVNVPAEISKLTSLRRLDLSHNAGRTASDHIARLGELRELVLADSFLTALPISYSGLKKLRLLVLAGNLFSSATAAEIRLWFPRTKIYFNNLEASSEPMPLTARPIVTVTGR